MENQENFYIRKEGCYNMKPKNYEVLMDIYIGVLNATAIQFTTEDFGIGKITFI